jgi:hypothetical protein
MKAYFLFTGTGPIVILTSYDSIESHKLLEKLKAKGIPKFIAHEVSLESAKAKYGSHFEVVLRDLYETDDLRVLDYSGERAYRNFSFTDLGSPIYHEPD